MVIKWLRHWPNSFSRPLPMHRSLVSCPLVCDFGFPSLAIHLFRLHYSLKDKKKRKKKYDYLVVPIWLLPKPIDVQVQHREVFFFFGCFLSFHILCRLCMCMRYIYIYIYIYILIHHNVFTKILFDCSIYR